MSQRRDDRLDELLAAWASPQRLTPDEAGAVLRAVVAEPRPTSLPVTWWSDLSERVTAAVVLAAARPVAPPAGAPATGAAAA
jgi:hypothetical protein